jgi:thiol-disulfide isomerase/thioredoxin
MSAGIAVVNGVRGHAARARLAGRCLAAVVAAAALAWPAAGIAAPKGIGASDDAVQRALEQHTLRTLDGRSFTLGSLHGGVVVVNFWATWCRPCQRELPALAALNAELARQGGQVVAVSIDEDVRNVERFVREHRLTLPVAQDGPNGLARQLDLQYVPMTLVLDRRGEVAFVAQGANAQGLERAGARARELLASPTAQAGAGTTP